VASGDAAPLLDALRAGIQSHSNVAELWNE
jgi:hypothetical protein